MEPDSQKRITHVAVTSYLVSVRTQSTVVLDGRISISIYGMDNSRFADAVTVGG